MNTEGEKLQKVLARAGYGSRRELEEWIREGRVSVNGKRAAVGDRVTPHDKIRVDGHLLDSVQQRGGRRRVIAYHKPEGEVCTRVDPEGRPTIFDHLPRLRNGRWVAVGRLDINTAGLILLTNDGELANRLMHPSSEIEREYAVRVAGEVTRAHLKALREGVELEDGMARFERVIDAERNPEGMNRWFHVMLREGRNREVRRLWESQGLAVSRLIRVRYGPVALDRAVRQGKFAELSSAEIAALMKSVGMRVESRRPAPGRPAPGRPPRRPDSSPARHPRRR